MYEYKAQEIFHKCHNSVHSDHEFVQKNGCLNISFLLKNASQVTNTAEPLVSSPELKAQVSFSDHLSSVVCLSVWLSVCLSVCKLFIFIFFSRTTEPISNKLGIKHPRVKGIQVCSNEGPCPFPRGDNYEKAKIH